MILAMAESGLTMAGEMGASESLRRLWREHAGFVRAAIVRLAGPSLDADDVLQEVFIVAWRRHGDLREGASVRGWLHAIAARTVLAARRKARLRRFFGLDKAEEVAGEGGPGRDFEKAEAASLVYRALDRLSEKKRTVVILFEIEGLSGEEVAEVLGIPKATVWTRLHHARAELLLALSELQRQDPGARKEGA
jgi:RNA polymerase sigma-70 factor (ECF subfamily)